MGLRFTTLVAILAVVGCSGSTVSIDRRAFTSADSWYAPPPNIDEYIDVDKDSFAPVVALLQPEAQTALADVSAKRISSKEAARLAGYPLPTGKGTKYVLLRAVVLNEGTGAFRLGVMGSSVYVQHNCLGHSPAPMERKAWSQFCRRCQRRCMSCGMAE